ncbi:MAG: PrgI family protein [Candidatus Kerfeldbacteria bacterium]|nr:PrgI family protein [Candidatus Kerfeldbacteria bacterium]
MQQFIVPQFIDVEDKIFGPISVRQFLTLLVVAALIFADYQLVYKLIYPSGWFFAISSIAIFAFGGTFAFLKINGRPFHYFLLNVFVTTQKPRLRVWNRRLIKSDLIVREEEIVRPAPIPVKTPLTASKLTELSLIVDTGGAYREELEQSVETEDNTNVQPGKPADIFS